MKKLFAIMVLAAMVLASCVKQERFSDEMSDAVSVHFTVVSDIATKADFGTGSGVDELLVQAFRDNGNGSFTLLSNVHPTITPVDGANPAAWDVDIKLAKSYDYRIAFWAQKEGTGIYNTADLSAVAVDYSKIAINNDDADAFCAARFVTVAGPLTETVLLYRPLAQINLGTNDLAEYLDCVLTDDEKALKVAYAFEQVPSVLNIIGGEKTGNVVAATTSEPVSVAYAAADILSDETFTTADESVYAYLAMAYVLADKAKDLMECTATISTPVQTVNTVEVVNMPYQANYKTNIFGQLLTGSLHYDVEISPEFETPDYENEVVEEVATSLDVLNDQMEENKEVGTQEYQVSKLDTDEPEGDSSTIIIPGNTSSNSISFNISKLADGVKDIVIKDEDPTDADSNFKNTIVLEIPASVDLSEITVTVNTPDAHVILKQGNYSTVVATTASGTLVVASGATVAALQVAKGNVEIEAGATVTSIVRTAANPDAITYVTIGAPDVWTNKDAEIGAKLVVNGVIAEGVRLENGVYYIFSGTGMENFNQMWRNKAFKGGISFALDADIDMTGKTWAMLNSHQDYNLYLVSFDGQNHTISNLAMTEQGMFQRFAGIGDVTIKDVTFDNASVVSTKLNTSILCIQSYQNVLLENVKVINSAIQGAYKVAPLIATIYNESSSTVTATLKNCAVEKTTVTTTSYDFCTTGMVAFVYEGDNDHILFEGSNLVKDVTILKKAGINYDAHAAIYTAGSDVLYNEAPNVTVENVNFYSVYDDGSIKDADGNFIVANDEDLQKALTHIVDGEAIILADGTYNAGAWVRVTKSITIKAANAHQAIIDGKTTIEGNKTLTLKDLVFYNQSPYSVPASVHQYHAKTSTSMVSSYDGSFEVDNCVFTPTDDYAAIRLYGGNTENDHMTIANSTFSGVYSSAFRPIMFQGSLDVQGCTFEGVERYVAQIYGTGGGYASAITFVNNKVCEQPTSPEYAVTNLLSVGSGSALSNVTILVKDNTALDGVYVPAWTYACKSMSLIDADNITYADGCDNIVWQLQEALKVNQQ